LSQHFALLSYDKSPRAKTSSESWSIIFFTVSFALEEQAQSPAAAKLKPPILLDDFVVVVVVVVDNPLFCRLVLFKSKLLSSSSPTF
jgi:hypothetical protein